MIEVSKAKKYYNRHKRNQVTAIDNTTLQFPDKGLVAILGSSGCGKTTLLNMIGGLDKPDSGKVFVNGKRMNSIFSGHTDNIRNRHIGYIFQNYHLLDDMTVFNNVALVLRMQGIRKKAAVKESVDYVLEKVGLYRYRNRPATALSGGERQRVGIARAIVKNPDIIIADEPTGNLDSGNSLEVMNIIKTISKDKLVILVTHERDLAKFYADRIIEIVDGRVVSDEVNEHDNDLDYRVESKLYLKDFEHSEGLNGEGLNVSYYSDGSSDVNVTLVLRNGNLYIQCDGKKIEAVDDDSVMELVDDHYRALTKEEAEKNELDYSILDHGGKRRYHSIYNLFNMVWQGMKKVFAYPKIKKILLLGFVAAAMFIMYSVSSVLGITKVTDDEFLKVNKDYLLLKNGGNTVSTYMMARDLDGVGYVMPGDSMISMNLPYNDLYYQTSDAADYLNGSLSAVSVIDEATIIAGRAPNDTMEIVVDRRLIDNALEDGQANMVGLFTYDDFIGKEVTCGEKYRFTISGICDTMAPVIYADDWMIPRILMNSGGGGGMYYFAKEEYGVTADGDGGNDPYADNNADITPVEDAKGELKIKKGSMPDNDYEVIVPYNYRYEYKLGKKYTGKVNGKELTVVGYYTSTSQDDNRAYSNFDTCFYKYLSTTSSLTIYPTDAQSVLDYYIGMDLNIVDTYEEAKREYNASIKDTVERTLLIAGIVLLISLVEIFLMLRSSFLSRVKEVGILRAIGLKKGDVYKMFLGEILAITTMTAPVGFFIMGYILKTLTGIDYYDQLYAFDGKVVLISAAIVYVFNVIVGLIPVAGTLRKTPAAILSRVDVD